MILLRAASFDTHQNTHKTKRLKNTSWTRFGRKFQGYRNISHHALNVKEGAAQEGAARIAVGGLLRSTVHFFETPETVTEIARRYGHG